MPDGVCPQPGCHGFFMFWPFNERAKHREGLDSKLHRSSVWIETKHQPYLRQQSEVSQLSEFPVHLCVSNHIIEFMVDIWKLIKKETWSLASRVKGLSC